MPTSLNGLKICHLSPVQGRRDERVYTRECLPMLSHGVRPCIIGAHERRMLSDDIELIPVRKSSGRLVRILTASRFVWSALSQNAAIYHVHSPENIPAALILKLLFSKKVVYDAREDFPSMMLTKEYLPKSVRSLARTLTFSAEKLAARLVDGFVTADPGTMRNYSHAGESKKLVFYNLPNLRYFPDDAQPAAKKFDLVYRGGLSERAGTMVLLKAVSLLRERGVQARLLMFGYADSGRVTRAIHDKIAQLGIADLVVLGGVIPHADMARTLSEARIAVCPLLEIPKFKNNIPVKVFESWACGLPAIATDLPPIRPFFRRAQRSLLVKPGDPMELANVIQQLLARPDLIEEYGTQARRDVRERYNNAVESRKLASFYKKILAA